MSKELQATTLTRLAVYTKDGMSPKEAIDKTIDTLERQIDTIVDDIELLRLYRKLNKSINGCNE